MRRAPSNAARRSASSTSSTGLALLAASVLAGVLWDRGGPALTFLAGAALTAAAGLVAFALYGPGKIGGRKRRGA